MPSTWTRPSAGARTPSRPRHRRHRKVLTVLLVLGTAAPLTAAFVTWGPALLLAAAAAVFVATGSNAVLSVRVAQHAAEAQRPSAIGLFVLCYQLGGALGPALAAVLVLG